MNYSLQINLFELVYTSHTLIDHFFNKSQKLFDSILIFMTGPHIVKKYKLNLKVNYLKLDNKFLTKSVTIKKIFVRMLIHLNESIMEKLLQFVLISERIYLEQERGM